MQGISLDITTELFFTVSDMFAPVKKINGPERGVIQNF